MRRPSSYRAGAHARSTFALSLVAATLLLGTSTAQAASVTSAGSGTFSGQGTSAWPTTNRTGNVTAATGSRTVTGAGTSFTTELTPGNVISSQSGLAIGTVQS